VHGPNDFPDEPARDLLGLLRTMWLVEHRKSFPSPRRLHELEAIAYELKDAMLEARRSAPGSERYVESIRRADAVVARLADLVVVTDPALPVLEVAGARIRRRRR
jgi:hypothetical protein